MLVFIVLCCALLTGYGTFYLLCELTDATTAKASKAMFLSMGKHRSCFTVFSMYLFTISVIIQKILKLQINTKGRLANILAWTKSKYSPELYCIKFFVLGIFLLLGILPIAEIHILIFLFAFFSVLFFCFYQYSSIFTAWKKHEQSIQEELMTFSIIAVQYLENKTEIEGLLQLYNSIAGIDFKKEIVLLLEDSRKDSLQFAIECFRQRIQKKQCIAVFELLGKEMPEEEKRIYLKTLLFQMYQNKQKYLKRNIKATLFRRRLFFIFSLIATMAYFIGIYLFFVY